MTNEIRHVAVVGLNGAGKSTVGSALARLLGWSFRDSDADIEATTGETVRELGTEVGVPAMHDLEARQLLAALDEPGPSVVSAAASTIDVEACRERLVQPDVIVLWLRATPGTLAARFGSSSHRPSYGSDPATFLADQAARRYPLYESVHPVTIEVDGLQPAAVVSAALDAIEACGLRPPPAGPGSGMSHGPASPGRMDLQPGHDDV
jgi:shikimate kinase